MRTMMLLVALAGCAGDADKGGDTSDTDAVDTDPTTPGDDDDDTVGLSAAGVWVGSCEGDVTFTSTSSSTYTYTNSGHLDVSGTLDLVDTGGDVTGVLTYVAASGETSTSTTTTSGGFDVAGTRTDDALHLEVLGYTVSTSSSSTSLPEIVMDLVIDGDTMTGDFAVDNYYGTDELYTLPCTFTR